ncbi:MAG: hypothetical protein HY722_10805 [Planctomycetes bacterium]|nr:hypothetical protein [Planctomycetota bacterium]
MKVPFVLVVTVVTLALAAWVGGGALAGGEGCCGGGEASASAPADPADKDCGGGCPLLTLEGDPTRCFDDLGLSAGQRDKVLALQTTMHESCATAGEGIRKARMAWSAGILNGASRTDLSKLRKLVLAADETCMASKEAFFRGLRGVLSEEQRAHLARCASGCGKSGVEGCGGHGEGHGEGHGGAPEGGCPHGGGAEGSGGGCPHGGKAPH